jgi:hypothetical protein
MTPRQYFALVLRGIGIWKLAYALEVFTTAWNVYEKLDTTPYVTAGIYVAHGLVDLAIGFVLLFGATVISVLVVPAGNRDHSGSTNV